MFGLGCKYVFKRHVQELPCMGAPLFNGNFSGAGFDPSVKLTRLSKGFLKLEGGLF